MTSGFKATDEEHQLAAQILVMTECHEARTLSSEAAIDIFKRSGLSFTILRDIWSIADKNGSGDLSLDELAVAIRLMGWVQMGEALDDGLLLKDGPLPTLEGITDVMRKHASSSSHPQQFPPVSPDDLRHYKRVFINAGPVNGRLEGGKVLNSFMTSNLSYEELYKIKKLIDKTERGSLDLPEFSLGMYLIQALQSSANMSMPSLRPSASSLQLSPVPSSSKSTLDISQPIDPWAILPHEKAEADQHFAELDVDQKGYVDGEPVGRFFLSYGLPAEDLQRIWDLANLNNDNRLRPEGFAIALHLIRQRLAGANIPSSLPSPLVQRPRPAISRRTSVASPTSPTLSAMAKSKPPPPPPPKRDRTASIRVPNGTTPILTSPTIPSSSTSPNLKYTAPLSMPVSPTPPRSHSRTPLSVPTFSMMNIPSPNSLKFEVQSPFDDSVASSLSPPSRNPTPSPQPRPPDKVNTEALEEFKKETTRLSAQVDSLLSQLTAQNRLRDSNENLRNENDTLKSQLRDMERTVSEVLSATDLNGSKDEYIQQVDRLTVEMAGKDSQIENLERMLAVVTQDERELRDSFHESQQATTKAKNEVESLKGTISTQNEEITELKSRLTDMGKAMSEPSSTANTRELRVLIRDVTKENDQLKGRLRDMEKSMEQLLLSSKFHGRADELERENKRLKQSVQELEMIAVQSQSRSHSQSHSSSPSSPSSSRPPPVFLSSHPTLNGRSSSSSSSRGTENLTRENEQLKAQLEEIKRKLEHLKSSNQTKISELQQKIESLTRENHRLKIDVRVSRAMPAQEDNSVPPPAYDDSFVIPP
ncbi:hypothetical protein CPB84DRAFT_1774611 [Gymnopilus junonius]|uniref:EF-hand n=1 Tax=Gymnopilus junonius TaxID=109634 RepID=A0A9P5NSW3_GYMJU|nr:hypothetical protein CPB84DRAFT_1774611 [Gymnopilus junonius]